MMNNSTKPLFTDNAEKVSAISSLENAHQFALYIGKGATVIHENMLKVNYAGVVADNLFSAQHTLLRLFQTHNLTPDVIICDAHLNVNELKSFLHFVTNNGIFYTIPFLLLFDETKSVKLDTNSLHNLSGVDDIIFCDSLPEDINHKIGFVKKFKELRYTNIKNSQDQTEYHVEFSLNRFLKRLSDILVSSLLIILLSPILILIAIAIKLDSKGSIFYTSLRAGRGYKIFKFYKFRTMVIDADKKLEQMSGLNQYVDTEEKGTAGALFIKVKNDPRVTRVGAFLRNTSLDELPQLFNVLKGDMSLVGNRPLPLYEAVTLTRDEWAERFLAPAGITGLWQVSKRGKKEMSAEDRINLDITYAHKNSFLYDMRIIASTPFAMIQKENV